MKLQQLIQLIQADEPIDAFAASQLLLWDHQGGKLPPPQRCKYHHSMSRKPDSEDICVAEDVHRAPSDLFRNRDTASDHAPRID